MARGTDVVELCSVNIEHETDNAILVRTEKGEELWLPLSQVEEIHRNNKTAFASRLVITKWIARIKGLA